MAESFPHTSLEANGQLDSYFQGYVRYVTAQPYSNNTKRVYLSRVRYFLIHALINNTHADLSSPSELQKAVAEYINHLKHQLHVRPNSLNANLTTLTNFLSLLGERTPPIAREKIPRSYPRFLTYDEQQKFVAALQLFHDERDRALGFLLLYTGIRSAECAALNTNDVHIGQETVITIGKPPSCKLAVLTDMTREATLNWLHKRSGTWIAQAGGGALFLSRQGDRLTCSGIDCAIRKAGLRAGLVVSPQVLRSTWLISSVSERSRRT